MIYISFMPRKARITVTGALHHIMSRGIEGKSIFLDGETRRFFLTTLEMLLQKTGYLLYAWCLMDNHYHLLIRINEYPLGRFMGMLNSRYAQYFRKKSGTRGYLFQDRYRSIVTQDQNYIEEMVRYIHLNPLRAGICQTVTQLDTYPWTGHGVIVGKRVWKIQNTADILKRFNSDHTLAIERYRTFLKDGLQRELKVYDTVRNANSQSENVHHTGCWVIGNKEFVTNAIAADNVKRTRLARYAQEGIRINDIVERISRQYGLTSTELMKRGKNNLISRARKVSAYTLHRIYGIAVIEIARYFAISSPAVSVMISEGEKIIRERNK